MLLFLHFFCAHNKNCSLDLNNKDLRTTIILCTLPLLLLSYLLHCMISSLMYVLEGECLCLHEISKNVNKLPAVLLLPVYLFIRLLFNTALYCYLFTSLSPFFTNVVVLFLFIRWSLFLLPELSFISLHHSRFRY